MRKTGQWSREEQRDTSWVRGEQRTETPQINRVQRRGFFSINGVQLIIHIRLKREIKKLGLCLTPNTENNSGWAKNPNV